MVYYTTWDWLNETSDLYKEWVGHVPEFKGIRQNDFLIVARDDSNKIVGAAQLLIVDDPIWDRTWGLVENVFVTKLYRNCGIGKGLMRFVEEQAKLLGCRFIKLTTRKLGGRELYRSLSYDEGSSFYRNL